MPRNLKSGLLIGCLVVGTLAAVGAGFLLTGEPASIARIGEALPGVNLPPIEGIEGSGVELEGATGRVTIINAFASWCLPCREEHPRLLEIAERYDVLIVGMNVSDLPENAEAFLEELGNPYDLIGADPRRETFLQLGLVGMPHTIVTDASGVVRASHPGPIADRFVNETLPALLD